MSAFMFENVESIIAACGQNSGALAESFGQCFDRKYRLEPGDSGGWVPENAPSAFQGPGLLTLFQVGTQGLAVLVPASLPLPAWYARPNDTEKARLETLPMEWSMNLLPADLEAERFGALVVGHLAQAVNAMRPGEWAATLELLVFEDGSTSTDPVCKLLVVWPLEQPDFGYSDPSAPAATPAAVSPQAPVPHRADPLARLRHLPIEVSVRLAEKKIPMSQLLTITPGMLITFNKSCEDLLDLYVNNSRYCRGEAVKIGENFGLKINQVGIKDETPHKVIEA